MRHRWESNHEALRRIYDARIGESMNQRDFGRRVGISQSMVAQLLSGDRPLSIDLAHKLARELGCTIEDICPPMAAYLRNEVVPVLGKALRRAAVVLAALFFQFFQPSDANAKAVSHNLVGRCGYLAKSLNNIHIVTLRLYRRFRDWALGHTLQMFGTN